MVDHINYKHSYLILKELELCNINDPEKTADKIYELLNTKEKADITEKLKGYCKNDYGLEWLEFKN